MSEAAAALDVGDIVHYFSDYYGCVAAVVAATYPEREEMLVDLVLLRPTEEPATYEFWVSYSAEPKSDTWHHKGHGAPYLPPWKQQEEGDEPDVES